MTDLQKFTERNISTMSSGKITVEFKDDIAIITMKNGKNVINMDFVTDFNTALDEVIGYVYLCQSQLIVESQRPDTISFLLEKKIM